MPNAVRKVCPNCGHTNFIQWDEVRGNLYRCTICQANIVVRKKTVVLQDGSSEVKEV